MAITLVQSKGASGNSGTSLSVTGLTATTAGNLLVAMLSVAKNPGDVTFTGPVGWTQLGTTIHDDVFISESIAVFYLPNCGSGVTSVSASCSAAADAWHLYVMEFSGCATTSPADGTTGREQTGLTPSSGSITTTADGDLIIGWSEIDEVSGAGDTTITQPAGYTALTRLNDTNGFNSTFIGWTTQTTAGAINYAPTKSRSDSEGVFTIAAFKAAAGGGGGTPHALSGAISADVSMSAALVASKPLSGGISADTALSASLVARKPLSGAISGDVAASGSLVAVKPLSGAIGPSDIALSGTLTVGSPTKALSGAIAADVALSGALTVTRALSGSIAASTALAATLIASKPLAGSIAADVSLLATLSTVNPAPGRAVLADAALATVTLTDASVGGASSPTDAMLATVTIGDA